MLETYALDGVNFDYEFPGTPQREKEFSAFLVSLDKVLKDDYLITAALSSGWCKNTTPEAIAALDTVQLMDYDSGGNMLVRCIESLRHCGAAALQ